MRLTRIFVPIFLILVGLVSFIGSLNIPKAKLGDPYGPLYFPIIISSFLFVMSIVYFITEIKKEYKENEDLKLLFSNRTPLIIVSTLVLALIYSLIFEKIEFLISTILFLGGLLFVVNGRKKWIVNIIVSVGFSFSAWLMFAFLLKVTLP